MNFILKTILALSVPIFAADKVELETLYLKAVCEPKPELNLNHKVEVIFNYIPSGPESKVYQTGMEELPLETCEQFDMELSADGKCESPYRTPIIDFDFKATEAGNEIIYQRSWSDDDGQSTYVGKKTLKINKSLLNSLSSDSEFEILIVERSQLNNEDYNYDDTYTCIVDELINKNILEKN